MPESSRPLRWFDMISLNIYFLGLSTLSQTLTPLVVPLLVQQFVGEGRQGAAYGNLRLWTLMVALLVQALMGMLSDRSTSRFGRRRPFILIGTLFDLVFLAAIAFTAGLQGSAGYTWLFIFLVAHMVATNTAQGAVQGFIPDLVPVDQRGRYSGIKALLEVPLPVIFTSLVIGRMVAAGNIWGAMLTAMAMLVVVTALALLAPEKPITRPATAFEFAPLVRLLLMTILFTTIILGIGQAVTRLSLGLHGQGLQVTLWLMGLAGFAGMALAIASGVYFSVSIAVGRSEEAAPPAYRWWVISRLAFLVGSTNIAGFALYFLQGRLGLSGQQAAEPTRWLLLVVGIFILITAPPSGWLADRFGLKFMAGLSGLIAFTGTMIAIAIPNLIAIYLGGVLIGAAAGIFYTANWALGTKLVPAGQAGRYLGISNLAGAGAGAVGAYIGGPVADFFTRNVPQAPGIGYVLLFAIYAGLFLFSVIALTRVPFQETSQPAQHAPELAPAAKP